MVALGIILVSLLSLAYTPDITFVPEITNPDIT